MMPGQRISIRLYFAGVSTYDAPLYKGANETHTVWRYAFLDNQSQRFVYSGKYIHGIDVKRDIGKAFDFRATIKRLEPRWNCIRLMWMKLQVNEDRNGLFK